MCWHHTRPWPHPLWQVPGAQVAAWRLFRPLHPLIATVLDSTGPRLSIHAKKNGGTCLKVCYQRPFVLAAPPNSAPPPVQSPSPHIQHVGHSLDPLLLRHTQLFDTWGLHRSWAFQPCQKERRGWPKSWQSTAFCAGTTLGPGPHPKCPRRGTVAAWRLSRPLHPLIPTVLDSTAPRLSIHAKKSGRTCLKVGNQRPFVLGPPPNSAPPPILEPLTAHSARRTLFRPFVVAPHPTF